MKKIPIHIGDIHGGITAAVVALPLALAFGVASGAGAIAGLYGAIAVGFFAAVFGGTNTQVSGPTGPMTVVMGGIIAQHADSLGDAFAIVVLGGIIQIFLGILKVGRFISYTPYSVVSGFMSGIGIIIITIQILPFLGFSIATGGTGGAFQTIFNKLAANGIGSMPANFIEILSHNPEAWIISLLSLAIMVYWPASLKKWLPSALAALLAGTLLGFFYLTKAPVIGNVPTGLPEIYNPLTAFTFEKLPSLIQPAFILALLGAIDSLLTSLVADSITRTRHKSDKELVGQGLGNIFAGIIGGIPGAGATMRTVVNVRAGGKTRLSGALHSLILLALALGLGPVAEKIPHAVLAGILMKVGWDIIDWGYLLRMNRAPRNKVIVMVVTMTLTVFVDLITAVAIGLILASFVTAEWMEQEELKGIVSLGLDSKRGELSREELLELKKYNGKIGLITLRGHFSYASARQLMQQISDSISHHQIMIFDFSHAAHIDTSAALAIDELVDIANTEIKGAIVSGLSGEAESTLKALGLMEKIPEQNIAYNRLDAIRLAGSILDGSCSEAEFPATKI